MILMCKNMTNAIKANKVLYDNGITSRIEKITDNPDVRGCVYSVVFDDRHKETAFSVLCKSSVVLHKKEKNFIGVECNDLPR